MQELKHSPKKVPRLDMVQLVDPDSDSKIFSSLKNISESLKESSTRNEPFIKDLAAMMDCLNVDQKGSVDLSNLSLPGEALKKLSMIKNKYKSNDSK